MNTENFTIHPKQDPIEFAILDGDTNRARIKLVNKGAGHYELYDVETPSTIEQSFHTDLKQDALSEYLLEQTKQHYESKAETRKMNPKELYLEQTIEEEFGDYGEGFMRDLRSGD